MRQSIVRQAPGGLICQAVRRWGGHITLSWRSGDLQGSKICTDAAKCGHLQDLYDAVLIPEDRALRTRRDIKICGAQSSTVGLSGTTRLSGTVRRLEAPLFSSRQTQRLRDSLRYFVVPDLSISSVNKRPSAMLQGVCIVKPIDQPFPQSDQSVSVAHPSVTLIPSFPFRDFISRIVIVSRSLTQTSRISSFRRTSKEIESSPARFSGIAARSGRWSHW